MKFVQLMEFRTTHLDEIRALSDEMDEQVSSPQSRSSVEHGLVCRDRDRENSYVMIVEFPSYEVAMSNSELPETTAFAERMAKLCDGPITYRNLDLLQRME